MKKLLSCFLLLTLSACAGVRPSDETPLRLEPASFSALRGWDSDSQDAALDALRRSCVKIRKVPDDARPFGPNGQWGDYGAWKAACSRLPPAGVSAAQARAFFEQNFTPWQASAQGTEKGLFTGYYEASLKGARAPGGPYRTPLYKRPADLVTVDLGEFRDTLKGQRIAGRVVDGTLKPYEDREKIVEGKWPHAGADNVLVWVDDPVDAFFVQIQGSGRVALADGGEMRIGYAAQNGYPYYAVGRELVKRGIKDKSEVSMDSIRAWMEENPDMAQDLMNLNRSYVFFREMPPASGPEGGQGVPLTPGRSLAVDRAKIPYGVPVWIDTTPPVQGESTLRRLMVAQDTGGAIRGAVRGDVFWGHGAEAERLAGPMKSEGRAWMLLPKGFAPVAR